MPTTAAKEALDEPGLQAVVERNVAEFLQLKPELLQRIGVSVDTTLSSPTEEQAHIVRLQRLVSDPSIRAALRTIRFTPQAWRRIEIFLARADELREAASVPGDLVRALTPLLAGIFRTPRAYAIWTVALQRAVIRESNEIARRIDAGRNYSHDLIVGSGWHGEVLATTMVARRPESDIVCIDDAGHIGGQFEASTGEVHLLNSRTRPERADLPNIPGREGSLNPMGLAPLQQGDVETLSYGTQARFGNLIATNHWFAAPTLVKHDVLWARRSLSDPEQYEITARDKETGKRITTLHDRVTLTTGIGSCKIDLPGSNDATKRLIARDQERPLAERRVVVQPDFITRVGDPDNLSPLQGWKRVGVFGPGDGGRIVVGKLTGHETDNKLSVPNLDWPYVRWYGQPAQSFEEFVGRERARYAQIGLELPRPEVDRRYYSRVQANAEKAVDIAEEIDGDGRPTGMLVVTDAAGKTRTLDHVVLAPGFVDRTMEALSTLNPDVYSDSREVPNDDLCKAGVRVLGDFGIIEVDEVIEPANGSPLQYEIFKVDKDGSQSVARVGREKLLSMIDANRESVSRVEVPRDAKLIDVTGDGSAAAPPRVFRDADFINDQFKRLRAISGAQFFDRDGVEIEQKELEQALRQGTIAVAVVPANRSAAIANLRDDPIARVVEGTQVYLAGPVSKLELTEKEKRSTPAFARIPSNTQAGFRYVPPVEALAGRFVRDDSLLESRRISTGRVGDEIRDFLTPYVCDPDIPAVSSELRRLTVQTAVGDEQIDDIVICADRGSDDLPQVPDYALYEDMVRLAACEADELNALGSVVDEPEATVRVEIGRSEGSANQWIARVSGVEPTKISELGAFVADPLVAEVADRYIDGGGSRATVTLPVVAGKLDVEGVAIRTQQGVSM